MKPLIRNILVLIALSGLGTSSHATVYLDDFWGDGLRNVQNLPTESAWFSSSGGNLTAVPGSMNLAVGGSSIMIVTYFTTNSTTPVSLGIGDTLVATFNMTFSGMAASNSSQGFRMGVFDFADSSVSRLTADSFSTSSQGSGVKGYALFQNMSAIFSSSSPMDVRVRHNLSSSSLLGTGADFNSLATGPGDITGFNGFANGTPYILQFSLQRTGANSMAVTMSWLNTSNGVSLITTTTDNTSTNFSYDGIAIRPANNTTAASTISFSEAKVELVPANTPPTVTLDPQDRSVFVGQTAAFSVIASGSGPLSYLWYYNSTTLLTNTSTPSLTLTNCQVSDSGAYSVVASNAFGTDTSGSANLSVTVPTAPTIVTQPQDQTVIPGQTATFNVVAGGSQPLTYQWYYNTSTLITGATDTTLTLTNIQPGNAGTYSVIVSNLVSTITSSNAVLNVNTNPVAPSFTSQPISATVLEGTTASFSAGVIGTQPIGFQWNKNGTPIPGANSNVLTLINAQLPDDGNYSLTASNNVGGVTSEAALLTVSPRVPVPNSAYNLVGFGQGTTGGGVLPDTDPAYAKVFTATDFSRAISNKNVKIIEIMNDLNLGYNEIEASAKSGSEPIRNDIVPSLHPVLLQTGVSLIDIQKKDGLTIFSANGSTIRHSHWNIKNSSNIIVRNLKFDELWEWDESSKGNYDDKNWDFMTIGDSGSVTGLWIDHCTFTKAYDGLVDIKNGSAGITISWCKYTGDDGATNPNSWVWQQINTLESNKNIYAMYKSLRDDSGFSTTDIVTIIQGHDKTHLIGALSQDPNNALHTVTLHHEWFNNPWDRLPRLRGGNVHDYNIYVDDTAGLAAKRLRDLHGVNSSYSFNPFLNGSISTENGAMLVEKSVYIDCLTPLRNNQTDPSDPTYTGKIEALDSIYHFDNTDGTATDFRGDSTNAPGLTYFGPAQATIIPFSWNLSGGHLPYTYYPDDPAQLMSIVTDPLRGAGAGVLTWNKTNWLVTSYAPTAPVIAADPQSQTIPAGQNASFVVVAGGSSPLAYQWYFNTNAPIANATNSTLVLTSIQTTNAGVYSVIVSNSVGSTNSAFATLTIPSTETAFQQWQMQYFNCTNCPEADANADPDGDGLNNQAEFMAGTNPTNSASGLEIISVVPQDDNVTITWKTGGGSTNVVQATSGDVGGSYATNFTDISGPIAIPGSGDVTTNYLDAGGATNVPSRFYRIRLGP